MSMVNMVASYLRLKKKSDAALASLLIQIGRRLRTIGDDVVEQLVKRYDQR